MKVIQLNCVSGKGSTGKICEGISHVLSDRGIENKIFYTIGNSELENAIKYSNEKYIKLQSLKSHVLGNYGFNSTYNTRKLLTLINAYNPDIVHIHNIHGHDCDLNMLFEFFEKKNIKLVWTFHDCWAFTGYCTFFTECGCNKWKESCYSCPQKKKYSWFIDHSSTNYLKKKNLFDHLDLTIVTPSYWLSKLVKQSFLKKYPVKIINNGIDLEMFRPIISNFREKYGCRDKFIILGVAFEWGARKGLDIFIKLANSLPEMFKIVLVGTNNKIDRQLPENIISIHRTNNISELAAIYSAADLFVNPTREDNFPTVNIESLACGTPVLTFDTGGSGETIDLRCGKVVPYNDVETLIKEIYYIAKNRPFTTEDCIFRASAFEMKQRFEEYLVLYERISEIK